MKQLNYRFAAVMLAFLGLVWLTYREAVLGAVLAPLTALTAQTTVALLERLGMEAARAATVISHPDGFACEIYFRCTGVLPVAFLVVSVLGYPGAARRKIAALAAGVPLLVLINQVRLVRLYFIGVHQPAAFHAAHSVVWEGIVIFAVAGLWLGWARWSDGSSKNAGAPWNRSVSSTAETPAGSRSNRGSRAAGRL